MLCLLQRDVHGYIRAKTVFPETKISTQEFCSDQELKLEMDGEMLSHKTMVPLLVVVDFFFYFFFSIHKQTNASLLSHSSFRIHMFFNKIWQKISTGTLFHQEKPD